MLHCQKCRQGLDTYLSASGSKASCEVCQLHYLSVGHLLATSDTRLIETLWSSVLNATPETRNSGGSCAHCQRTTQRVDFEYRGQPGRFLACTDCYLICMDSTTLNRFTRTREDGPGHRHRVREYTVEPHSFSFVLKSLYFLRSLIETPIGSFRLSSALAFLALVIGFMIWLNAQHPVTGFILGVSLVPLLKICATPSRPRVQSLPKLAGMNSMTRYDAANAGINRRR